MHEQPPALKRRIRVSVEDGDGQMQQSKPETPNSRCGFSTGESDRI
ncbi:hypothetical protein [Pelodictyon luteolum]|nr:hypothetical protein [Pelodictyon luteolum]